MPTPPERLSLARNDEFRPDQYSRIADRGGHRRDAGPPHPAFLYRRTRVGRHRHCLVPGRRRNLPDPRSGLPSDLAAAVVRSSAQYPLAGIAPRRLARSRSGSGGNSDCVMAGLVIVLGWPVSAALLFGALIAATDPVAVIAMFKDYGITGRLRLLVESESLFNDGVAAVLFTLALACAGRKRSIL